jgi:hypothetical protein
MVGTASRVALVAKSGARGAVAAGADVESISRVGWVAEAGVVSGCMVSAGAGAQSVNPMARVEASGVGTGRLRSGFAVLTP